jgi:hypothetical protein
MPDRQFAPRMVHLLCIVNGVLVSVPWQMAHELFWARHLG